MTDDISAQLARMQEEKTRIGKEEEALRGRAELELEKINMEIGALEQRKRSLEDFLGRSGVLRHRQGGVKDMILEIVQQASSSLNSGQITEKAVEMGINRGSVASAISRLIQERRLTKDTHGLCSVADSR
jgi:hypothetical protein